MDAATTSSRFRGPRAWLGVALAVGLLCLGTVPALAGIYMKLEGVEGGVTEGRFAKWSEVVGLGQEATRSEAAAEHPAFSFVVRKRFDRASPVLLQRCVEGVPVPRVTLVHEGSGTALYRVVLEDVMVSSLHQGVPATTGGLPLEQIAFSFRRASWSWIEVGEGGEVLGGRTAFFDGATGVGGETVRPAFRASVTTGAEPGSLLLRCPVEKGHRYRLVATSDLKERWQSILEFVASEDGVVEQTVRSLPPVAFLRVEELE